MSRPGTAALHQQKGEKHRRRRLEVAGAAQTLPDAAGAASCRCPRRRRSCPALTGKFSLGAWRLESGRPKAKTVVEAPRCCWKAASAGMVAPATGGGCGLVG